MTASRLAVSRASTNTTASVRRSTCYRAAPSRRARSVPLIACRWRCSGSQLSLGWILSRCDGRFVVVAGLFAQSRGQHLEVPRYRCDASPRGEGRRGGATCPPCLSRPYSLPRPPPTHKHIHVSPMPSTCQSFILDAEAVAMDRQTGEIKPFQARQSQLLSHMDVALVVHDALLCCCGCGWDRAVDVMVVPPGALDAQA